MSKILWVAGFYSLPSNAHHSSSYGRVDDYLHPEIVIYFLVPFALFHIAAILLNGSQLRRFCVMVGVAWWSGLAMLMFQFPPNWAAGIVYATIALFGVWCFVAARFRNEVAI